MAKFFPFIVEKSTPTYIYQAILSRSKGINNVLITSVFWLILAKGITSVRDHAKTLPDTMSMSEIYEELLNAFPNYRVSTDSFRIFQEIGPYLKVLNKDNEFVFEELNVYEIEDIMCFLMVVSLSGVASKYTNLPFEILHTEDYSDEVKKYKLFSNKNGIVTTHFSSYGDMRGYFHLYGPLFSNTKYRVTPVTPVLGKTTSSDYEVPVVIPPRPGNSDSSDSGYSKEYSDDQYADFNEARYADTYKKQFEKMWKQWLKDNNTENTNPEDLPSKKEKLRKEFYESRSKVDFDTNHKAEWTQKPYEYTPDPKKDAPHPDKKSGYSKQLEDEIKSRIKAAGEFAKNSRNSDSKDDGEPF